MMDVGLLEFDWEIQLAAYKNNQLHFNDIVPDHAEIIKIENEEVKKEDEVENGVLTISSTLPPGKKEEVKKEEDVENNVLPMQLTLPPISFRKKRSPLLFDEIKKHFDVPQTTAAKNMNVGMTILKKRCKELNITKWPYRKFKTLQSLISDFKVCSYVV